MHGQSSAELPYHCTLQYGSTDHLTMGRHLPPSSSGPWKGSGLFPSRLIQA